VPIGLGCVLLITLGNLRGIRESVALFAAPTYLFIGAIMALIAIGLFKVFVLHDARPPACRARRWRPRSRSAAS